MSGKSWMCSRGEKTKTSSSSSDIDVPPDELNPPEDWIWKPGCKWKIIVGWGNAEEKFRV